MKNSTKEVSVRYARVIDNFAANDKGKFIGQIGKVLEIVCDYYCFSQVRLQFKNNRRVWFSNTTLEEVDKDGVKIEKEENGGGEN